MSRIPIERFLEHVPRDDRGGWRGLVAYTMIAAGGLAIVYVLSEVCR